MSITLPGALTMFTQLIGFKFPEGQETEIMQWAQKWQRFSDAVTKLVEATDRAADEVKNNNKGAAKDAFTSNFESDNSPKDVSKNLSKAAKITGTCLLVIGAAILVLKIISIVDLSVFCAKYWSAIAAIPATYGASLGWIPPAQAICKTAVQLAIETAAKKVLG
ncbi:hypothetical protein BW730_10330 [Tessaracoccus aquimaris]|uniref:Outer membrane channel protein CpnT-like N-terminal domain-containing protein n=1 Tax=Tessaracoccus aquimaris TaxID=1332264 RepID=A0A1Q2CNZ0_9ACTN|nr:hypothetical protein [Tessaracoccus aquimaris]AQP47832.1 hypothetical protein BW730_10330 [Tessaracoccus aquimaris]